MRRLWSISNGIFGAYASTCIMVLQEKMVTALTPRPFLLNERTLGISEVIAITEHALRAIGNNPKFAHLDPEERWHTVTDSVDLSAHYTHQTQLYHALRTRELAKSAATEALRSKPTAAAPTTQRNRKRKQQPGAASSETAPNTATTTSHRAAPCQKQDLPGGCPYGLQCKYAHRADKPKADATKRPRPDPPPTTKKAEASAKS